MWPRLRMISATMACRWGVIRRPWPRRASMICDAVEAGALDIRAQDSICNKMQKKQGLPRGLGAKVAVGALSDAEVLAVVIRRAHPALHPPRSPDLAAASASARAPPPP